MISSLLDRDPRRTATDEVVLPRPEAMRRRSSEPVFVALALVRTASELLLVHERRDPAVPAGTWLLPGGRIEVGESIGAATRRELREESGLRLPPDPGMRLCYVVRVHDATNDGLSVAFVHGVELDESDDRRAELLAGRRQMAARLVPLADALDLVRSTASPAAHLPLRSYLSADAARDDVTCWDFRAGRDGLDLIGQRAPRCSRPAGGARS